METKDILPAKKELLDKLDRLLGSDSPVIEQELYACLLELAKLAAYQSYSPYSKFPVGAAALAEDGRVFLGCNVENASYGGTICAERTAIVKAVSEGVKEFRAIAIDCPKAKNLWPCGICRQFISEFGASIDIVSLAENGEVQKMSIEKLVPRMFGPSALEH